MLMRHAQVLVLFAALGLASCGAKGAEPPPPPKVTVATPLRESVTDWDDYVGQFIAVDSVDVRPRVSGYLVSVGFRDGQIVRKGQTLFEIDPRPYQATLDQAQGQLAHSQAAAANANTEAVRGQQLLALKAISQQAYDTLVAAQRQTAADLISSEAGVRAAALNLSFTHVTAPLSGRVSDRRVAPGNLVAADTTVLTNIVNLDPIRFAFTGSEALYLKQARSGVARAADTPVEIRLQDEPTYRWRGKVDFTDNVLDTGSGTIRGRATIPNPGYFLTPGMFGHMRLQGAAAHDAILLPDQAVFTDQTRQLVYIVGPNNVVRQQPVSPGPLVDGLREIRDGLGPNDHIIIEGVQRARPGQKVTPVAGKVVAQPSGAPALAPAPEQTTGAASGGGR
jgi:RND family efflux transporter MFP subunit